MTNHKTPLPAALATAAATTTAPLLVGVGASAGGLEAFQEFLTGLDDTLGVSIVYVQHQDPQVHSQLPEVLARSTSLEVVTLTERTKIKANALYICPPHALLEIRHGSLLIEDQPEGILPTSPIDHFFRSLAENQGESGIGIILSGAGSDGTLGLKSISDYGLSRKNLLQPGLRRCRVARPPPA